MAVSPESITASVPSSTALKTSLASARVGRLELSMLLSICVAVITGTRARWQAAITCFWIAGTRATSISTPRSPRATITASETAMIASRFSTACGFSILATIRAAMPRRSSSSRSAVTSAARRTKERPMYSTGWPAVQSRSSRSLGVRALTLSGASGRLIPCDDRSRPPSVTVRRAPPSAASTTVMATVPSAK